MLRKLQTYEQLVDEGFPVLGSLSLARCSEFLSVDF